MELWVACDVAPRGNTVSVVRRFSPFLVVVLAVAAAIAWVRSSDTVEADEDWTPVRPS